MSIGPNKFETNFETTGGGTPNPQEMAAINEASQSKNWTSQTRVMDHATGEVMPGSEFTELCAQRKLAAAQQAAIIALAETTPSRDLYYQFAA